MKPKLLLYLPLVLGSWLSNDNCKAAIIFPKQAEEYRAIAHQETFPFYHDTIHGFFPKDLPIDKLNLTNGFGWYWFDDQSVLSGNLFPPTNTNLMGWHCMIMCGTNMIGMMGLAWETNHWSFDGLISSGATLKGQQDPIWVALEKAERLPQVRDEDFEFRYLTRADMDFPMVWLHGKSDHILIPISDGYGKWEAYKAYSEKQMTNLLKSMLEDSKPCGGAVSPTPVEKSGSGE
jgi:hypothetical protein